MRLHRSGIWALRQGKPGGEGGGGERMKDAAFVWKELLGEWQ